ncbi:MAG: PRC-barrel domain-containing protein [Candidatus Methanomethylophilaceae archaeon]
MVIVRYRDIIGSQVVTSDAFVLGEVEGIRYDPSQWHADYLLVSVSKGLEPYIGAGKSVLSASKVLVPMDLIKAGNQAIILAYGLIELKEFLKPDNVNIPNISHLLGKKVVSSDNQPIGSLYDLNLEVLQHWPVVSFVVRLDKSISDVLGVKKPLFSRLPVITLDIGMVRNITELIHLDRDVSAIREEMTVGN